MTALQGKDVIWKYRLASKASEEDAFALAYTTENGYSKSKDSDSTATKDGAVVTPGALETTANITTLYKIGDKRIDEMESAMDEGARLEIWRINTKEFGADSPNDKKCKAKYFEGYLTSFEETDTAEDNVEYSMELALEGVGADGFVTFDPEAELESYKFKDTIKEGTPSAAQQSDRRVKS